MLGICHQIDYRVVRQHNSYERVCKLDKSDYWANLLRDKPHCSNRQSERQAERYRQAERDRQAERETDRQRDRLAGRDRQAVNKWQTDRQTDRQTNRQKRFEAEHDIPDNQRDVNVRINWETLNESCRFRYWMNVFDVRYLIDYHKEYRTEWPI